MKRSMRLCRQYCCLLIVVCFALFCFSGCDEEGSQVGTGSREAQETEKETEKTSAPVKVGGVIEIRRDGTQFTGAAPVPWGAVGTVNWYATIDPEDTKGVIHGFSVTGNGEGEVLYDAPAGSCTYNRGGWMITYEVTGALYADCHLRLDLTEIWTQGEGEMECPPYGGTVISLDDTTMKFSILEFPHEETGWTITTQVNDGWIDWINTFTGKYADGTDIDPADCKWFVPIE